MLTAFTTFSIVAYLVAGFLVSKRISSPQKMQRRTLIISILALIGHFVVVATVLTETALVKINLFTTLAIITWLICLFNSLRGEQPASLLLRPSIFALAAMSLVALYIVPADVGRPLEMTPVFALHISLALLASSILTLATLYGVQLLYVNRLLKTHSVKAVSERMPSLMSVEQYFFRLLTAGTVLLTFAIIVGFFYLDDIFARGQLHKTIFSLAACLSFGAIVVVHHWRGLRGRIAVYYTIVASVLLVLGYFGSRFVRDIIIS
ncbi:ABC transporter permease [Aliidiomarina shirensis]|uniref:ABC transporter permease n=1 Tax=Aliidiomarina shirensis TaxID=1048642 RepID=A0A432WTU3_9GAMM|nr:cytochrome c biogenesis protein CcsA [Aliidiomarina shirensis]RUO37167.1 ABC transporter permease [Aliidiomarina shirensis]